MKKRFVTSLAIGACLAVVSFSNVGHATTIVHGIAFDDNAFPDVILQVNGAWSPAPDLSIFGPNPADNSTFNWPYDESSFIRLGFTDNWIVNGPGADLALFENSGQGWPGLPGCSMRITMNGVTKTYAPYWIDGPAYLASINLDDFGVTLGGTVSTITLWGGANDSDYMTVGALNNGHGAPVPEPATMLLFGTGIAGLAGTRLRRKRQ